MLSFSMAFHWMLRATRSWISKLADAVVSAVSALASRFVKLEKEEADRYARIEELLEEISNALVSLDERMKKMKDIY